MKPTKHARFKLIRVRAFMMERRKNSKFIRRFTFRTWFYYRNFIWLDRTLENTRRKSKAYTSFYRGLCGHALKPVDKASLRLRKKYLKGQRIADGDRTACADWAFFNPYTEEIEERWEVITN